MGKNYSVFNKVAGFVLAMAMAVGFTSCEDILGHWDSPAVKQAVETIVTITGADPAQVTAALKNVVTDEAVAAAIAKGEPIKVTIAGSSVSTEATDQTITIPQKNGAAIEINFATAPSGTDSNALVLQASEGAGSNPGDANNNLVVSMPASEGLAITIELPNTTVTLKTDGSGAVVYKDVIAKTATSTIIIDKGVTIKEHELVGGNIVVKDGGAIETLAVTIKDNRGMITLGSWWSGVWLNEENGIEPEYLIRTENDGFYLPKNVKVKKGAGDYFTVRSVGPEDEYLEKLIIGEGVTIALEMNTRYKSIVGEGDSPAGLNLRGWINASYSDWEKQIPANITGYYYWYDFDINTESVSNVNIVEERPEVESVWNIPHVNQLTAEYTTKVLHITFKGKTNGETTFTFENCHFPASTQFNLTYSNYKRDANGKIEYRDVTKYCCFHGPNDWDVADYPTLEALQADHSDFTQEVGDRERGGYWTIVTQEPIELECEDFTGTLIFKNCTIGGNALNTESLLNGNMQGTNVRYKVKIDDTTYNVSGFNTLTTTE